MNRVTAIVLLYLVVARSVAARDVTLRRQTTIEGPSPRAYEETVGWTDRVHVIDGPRERRIIDLEGGTIARLDKGQGSCTLETLAEVRRKLEPSLVAMHRRRQRMSSEQRQLMARMGVDPFVRFSLRSTGRRATVAGLDAKEVRLSSAPLEGSIWVSSAIEPPHALRAWEPFAGTLGGFSTAGTKLAAAIGKIGGFPVRTELSAVGQPVIRTDVLEVRERSPAPDLLLTPAECLRQAP